MTAYLVAHIEILDAEGFAEYQKVVPELIKQYGGRYLIRGGAIENIENDIGVRRLTVVEFENMDKLRAFFDSKEYQPMKAIRNATTKSNIAFVEGYDG